MPLYLRKNKPSKAKKVTEKGGKQPPNPPKPPVGQKEPPKPPRTAYGLTPAQQQQVLDTIRKLQPDKTDFYRFQTGVDDMLKPYVSDPLVRAKLAIRITSYAKANL